MNEATVAQTIMTLLILAVFIGLFVWGIRSKQFRNVEDPKYRMMDSDKEATDTHAEPRRGKKQP